MVVIRDTHNTDQREKYYRQHGGTKVARGIGRCVIVSHIPITSFRCRSVVDMLRRVWGFGCMCAAIAKNRAHLCVNIFAESKHEHR